MAPCRYLHHMLRKRRFLEFDMLSLELGEAAVGCVSCGFKGQSGHMSHGHNASKLIPCTTWGCGAALRKLGAGWFTLREIRKLKLSPVNVRMIQQNPESSAKSESVCMRVRHVSWNLMVKVRVEGKAGSSMDYASLCEFVCVLQNMTHMSYVCVCVWLIFSLHPSLCPLAPSPTNITQLLHDAISFLSAYPPNTHTQTSRNLPRVKEKVQQKNACF